MQIKGGPLLQKQLVHNATIANLVPRWHNFGATQFELQVMPGICLAGLYTPDSKLSSADDAAAAAAGVTAAGTDEIAAAAAAAVPASDSAS